MSADDWTWEMLIRPEYAEEAKTWAHGWWAAAVPILRRAKAAEIVRQQVIAAHLDITPPVEAIDWVGQGRRDEPGHHTATVSPDKPDGYQARKDRLARRRQFQLVKGRQPWYDPRL